MSRRDVVVRAERGEFPAPPPSKCAKVLYYTWRICSVVFTHFVMISLVVAYCILGAVTFEKLEAAHEKEVKMNISRLRNNTTDSIWTMTRDAPLFNESNWTSEVIVRLKDFESAILLEMKVRGWDGFEDTEHVQWTFTGALFYSIIVITTIGYGHIAPKTQTGKVVTIFYAILGIPLMLLCLSNIGDVMASSFRYCPQSMDASSLRSDVIVFYILGIPLMLLCLSNIGDVMASSFRFLYWRVCCYVCTRPPKRRRRHHPSIRRSVRGSTRHGSTRRKRPERAHSDTECRYRDSGYSSGRPRRPRGPPAAQLRTASQPPLTRTYEPRGYDRDRDDSPVRYDRYGRDNYDDEEEFPKISLPLKDLEAALRDLNDHSASYASKSELRSKSLPRPSKSKPDFGPRRDFDDHRGYEEDPGPSARERFDMHDLYDVDYENYRERKALEEREKKREREDYGSYRDRDYDPEDDDYEFEPRRGRTCDRRMDRSDYYERDDYGQERRANRRARSAVYECERRGGRGDEGRGVRADEGRGIGGDEGRNRRLRRLYTVDDSTRPPKYTPSPERDYWSDDGAVVPRRGRSAAAIGSRYLDIYPVDPEPLKQEIKPVPIWLCVCLVASYIVLGTVLFTAWESWGYLDAAYFCFITLTTIGFGDFVPAQGQSGSTAAAVHSIALCSLYLLFGIALLAMSFNLVQEQVRANVASLATKLGIIKPRDEDDEDY